MSDRETSVLANKRDATRYRILVAVAERQPAVSQQEIADVVGITAQAVSDYLGALAEEGFVRKHGRGRYEVTKEGVDWLISQTDDLRGYVDHVADAVIEGVEVDTALATAAIAEGDPVSLSMRDGVLHATPGTGGRATGVAVTAAAEAGADVGVTEFEGVLDYEWGPVTVVSVPRVSDGGSRAVDADALREQAADHDLVAAAGTEALAALSRADVDPDVRFGTADAVREAATRGLSVLLVAVTTELSAHTDRLREDNVGYELLEFAE